MGKKPPKNPGKDYGVNTFLFVIMLICESLRRNMDCYYLIPEVNHIWTLLDDLDDTVPLLTDITELKGMDHEIELKKLDKIYTSRPKKGKRQSFKFFRSSSTMKK